MAIYQKFVYSDGTKYGDAAKVGYSAEPLTAVAIGNTDYGLSAVTSRASNGAKTYSTNTITRPRVDLSWTNPTGSVYGFRIVRNQEGYSENEEDGVVILETLTPTNLLQPDKVVPAVTTFSDQLVGDPLKQGLYAYYTAWILLADNSWALAAYTYCLIPKTHPIVNLDNTVLKSSDLKFVELFPKVYTTEQQSYLDEVDTTSDFYNFFSGMAYTLDETLTYADLLKPDVTRNSINPAAVDLLLNELGLPLEPTLSIQRKKALIKNAAIIHKRRGTTDGVQLFSKSLTGFSTDVLLSPNILFSPQDSSFYKSIGNWVIAANGVLTSNATTGSTDLPYQSETYSIDRSYTGKVVTSSTNVVMSLGTNNPRLLGIPVSAGLNYKLIYYVKGTAANVTPTITWYDSTGTAITTAVGVAAAASSTWSKITFSAVAPVATVVIPVQTPVISSGTVTLTTSGDHNLLAGQTVTIFGLTPSGYNATATVTSTPTSNTFSYVNATTGDITVAGNVGTAGYSVTSNGTWFAGLSLNFASAGTYYVDMVQLALSDDSRSSSYYEANNVELNLAPTKINYFENPSLIDNADTDWVSSGVNTASITAATGNGTTVTYTASNTFKVGSIVTVTGLGVASGTSLNLSNVAIASVIGAGPTYTGFTVTNSTVGVSSGTGTATGKGFINSTLFGIKQDGSTMTALSTVANTAFSLYAKSSTTIPVNNFYTFSIYAATVSGSENLTFKVEAYDIYDNLLDSNIVGSATRSLINQQVTTSWARYQIPLFIPAQATNVYIKATALSPSAVVPISGNASPATGGIVTFNTSTLHGFKVGQTVTIDTIVPVGYRGTYTITAVSDTTFSFTSAITGAVTTAGNAVLTAQGNTLYFDAAQLEPGYGASDYFDGSYSSRGASWLGTAHNSISVAYRSKTAKLNRLTTEVVQMLPLNSSFIITTGLNGSKILETSGWSS